MFQNMLYVQVDTRVQSKTMNLRWSYNESIKFTCWMIKKRQNACLSLICENLFYIFPYTCFLLSLWVAVNSVTISSSHDRDSRSPIFFQNLCIYSSQSSDSRTFIFDTWCFNELEFICKTHVCNQINVLLGPTTFISKSCSREEKNEFLAIFWRFLARHNVPVCKSYYCEHPSQLCKVNMSSYKPPYNQ